MIATTIKSIQKYMYTLDANCWCYGCHTPCRPNLLYNEDCNCMDWFSQWINYKGNVQESLSSKSVKCECKSGWLSSLKPVIMNDPFPIRQCITKVKSCLLEPILESLIAVHADCIIESMLCWADFGKLDCCSCRLHHWKHALLSWLWKAWLLFMQTAWIKACSVGHPSPQWECLTRWTSLDGIVLEWHGPQSTSYAS